MDALGWTKTRWPWQQCLLGLLLQLFLALCFFSYLRVSQDTPLWSARSGADAAEALDAAPKGSSGTVSCQGAPCPTPPGSSPASTVVNVSAKTELVAWVVSNWREDSARVRYYHLLKAHVQVDVYGRSHKPLPEKAMAQQLSRYKFYLAFENSLHPDYITEKLWRNALEAWAVPVVLGPSRSDYEQFLPPDAFIHVHDFQSTEELGRYLQALDKDHARYLSYFRWRETLRPRLFSWALMFCKACRQLQ
uniref:Fucosyltransferase n=1 Tax=Panthera tigris altaica TaxID=74533 RepID=A0A8C9L3T1_PANTA